MRVNHAYRELFPNNCPIIETTGDGVEVGTCTYYLNGGICPRHGRLDDVITPSSIQRDLNTDDTAGMTEA